MEKIEISVKDKMDVALLLTGINWLRKAHITQTKKYLDLPSVFRKRDILDELVDEYDRLNTLAAQLDNLLIAKENEGK